MASRKDLVFNLTASAKNKIINIIGDPNSANNITETLKACVAGRKKITTPGSIGVGGTYSIGARFASPEPCLALRRPQLQILVHGLCSDRSYWSGFTDPGYVSENGTQYSWEAYAASRGYHTLAIDRLGCGVSSTPDPVTHVQDELQTELMHALIVELRSRGTIDIDWHKIIWVGHSYGSILGNFLSHEYPNDIDSVIMTGWTARDLPINGLEILNLAVPAREWSPERFGHLPPGYVILSPTEPVMASSPNSAIDPNFEKLSYAFQGPTAIGELTSQTITTRFKGDVFVLTGERDEILCPSGYCNTPGDSEIAISQKVFPDARSFDYFAVPDTGHAICHHYTSGEAFRVVHEWLSKLIQ